MRRFPAAPVLAVLFALACGETTTGPVEPKDIKPLLQSTESEVHCIGFLIGGTFQNVTVPTGTFCSLQDAVLTGNLKALPGSQLSTLNNTIAGDIQADKALFVDLVGDRVGGNIEIVDGNPEGSSQAGFLDYRVRGATVFQGNIHIIKNRGNVFVEQNVLDKGNIKVEDNFNLIQLLVQDNQVPGNIQVFKNSGSGPKVVRDNVAGQAIQCWENVPILFAEGNVAPKLEGQCAVPPALP
jgi:hypothetical protein